MPAKKKLPPHLPASSFEICLGRLWVHRPQGMRYAEIPLAYQLPNDDIHGELYFKIQGKQIPGMGYKAYDLAARDGACLIEWLMYLSDILSALAEDENAAYHFREYDLGGFSCEFVRDGDQVLFSIDGVYGPEQCWELTSFAWEDLLEAYSEFKAEFLAQVSHFQPSARPSWQSRFLPGF
ncbi:MAG: hypothetical protein AB7I41_08730 [Candidatus Sericytochromatia bacterium]